MRRLNGTDENVYSVAPYRETIATYPAGTYKLGSVVGPRQGERLPLIAYAEGNGRTRFAYAKPWEIMVVNNAEATTVTESRMQGAT